MIVPTMGNVKLLFPLWCRNKDSFICLSICLSVCVYTLSISTKPIGTHMKQLALLLTDLTRLISSGPSKVHLLA